MGNALGCINGPADSAGATGKKSTKRAPVIEVASYSTVSIDKERPDALVNLPWAQVKQFFSHVYDRCASVELFIFLINSLLFQVRKSLEEAQIPYRVILLNDKSFGMPQGNPRTGTFLVCVSNSSGNAIVDSVVKA
jgi:hypothetical protein